jgi:D-aspartate ligase
VDDNGLDVARALYRDLTGQTVRRSRQVDGRTFVVEPYDPSASIKYFWRGELSAHAWLRSFKGRKEFDWEDRLPLLMAWGRPAIRALRKIIRIGAFRSNAARGSHKSVLQARSVDAEPLRFRVRKSDLPWRAKSSSKAAVTPDQ